MRIKLNETVAIPLRPELKSGEVYDVEDQIASDLIDRKLAEPLQEVEQKSAELSEKKDKKSKE